MFFLPHVSLCDLLRNNAKFAESRRLHNWPPSRYSEMKSHTAHGLGVLEKNNDTCRERSKRLYLSSNEASSGSTTISLNNYKQFAFIVFLGTYLTVVCFR